MNDCFFLFKFFNATLEKVWSQFAVSIEQDPFRQWGVNFDKCIRQILMDDFKLSETIRKIVRNQKTVHT